MAVRIGELAAQAGMTRDAIRFYERMGLITAQRGNQGRHGYRRYDQGAVRRLDLIRQGKALGFSLGEIGELLEAWADHRFRPEQKRAVIADKLALVAGKIAALQALSATLQHTLDHIGDQCQPAA